MRGLCTDQLLSQKLKDLLRLPRHKDLSLLSNTHAVDLIIREGPQIKVISRKLLGRSQSIIKFLLFRTDLYLFWFLCSTLGHF